MHLAARHNEILLKTKTSLSIFLSCYIHTYLQLTANINNYLWKGDQELGYVYTQFEILLNFPPFQRFKS